MMNNAVKQLLTIWSWSQFLICNNYEAERSSQEQEHFNPKRKLYAVNELVKAFRSLKITVYVS